MVCECSAHRKFFEGKATEHLLGDRKKAVSNLNSKDVELLSSAVEQIKQRQREAEQRRYKEQFQQRQLGWGFER